RAAVTSLRRPVMAVPHHRSVYPISCALLPERDCARDRTARWRRGASAREVLRPAVPRRASVLVLVAGDPLERGRPVDVDVLDEEQERQLVDRVLRQQDGRARGRHAAQPVSGVGQHYSVVVELLRVVVLLWGGGWCRGRRDAPRYGLPVEVGDPGWVA